ncbi:hypothetical protein [Actinokineospora pegani]|uniref:hypothetical protein n=1 Tax=Actinokineospora pegani TaxID=2654637 RepID=UPI0012EABBDB|nr:hypothetical protein [Actinokineospora pegani]
MNTMATTSDIHFDIHFNDDFAIYELDQARGAFDLAFTCLCVIDGAFTAPSTPAV